MAATVQAGLRLSDRWRCAQAFFRRFIDSFGDRIRAKQAGEVEGSGEGRHPGYPAHLEQFYAQAEAALAPAKL